ncbi:hypothetical protein KL86PLE_30596 [uncultured Pleomorphomonas sp.]|uniref:Uncharacterized protein n=1 Tax=uncultured Pleomorphomonas sp. TaxID=442121 RepID=A0A212LFJ1_9HYPH|nr:hypothetical protein KL86PLE_30596 [uncultured Pleomorphomonas sp.]
MATCSTSRWTRSAAARASNRKVDSGFRKIRCDNKKLDRHFASVRTHDDLEYFLRIIPSQRHQPR